MWETSYWTRFAEAELHWWLRTSWGDVLLELTFRLMQLDLRENAWIGPHCRNQE